MKTTIANLINFSKTLRSRNHIKFAVEIESLIAKFGGDVIRFPLKKTSPISETQKDIEDDIISDEIVEIIPSKIQHKKKSQLYARVKGDANEYLVLDMIDPGVEGQNLYLLEGLGKVQQQDVESLEYK